MGHLNIFVKNLGKYKGEILIFENFWDMPPKALYSYAPVINQWALISRSISM